MKNLTVFVCLVVMTLVSLTFAQADNQLCSTEKAQGWKLLFDGKTSTGWKSNRGEGFPEKGWEIKDGTLSVLSKERGGDIISTEAFENFELTLDVKLTKGANSGIKYFIQEGNGVGCEFQVLDDDVHPDAKLGVNNNRQFGSLYDLIPAQNRELNPIGEWNSVRILVDGGHVEHWLNGKLVVKYDRFCPCFRQLILHSKFKDKTDFATFKTGHILLQDHGDTVSYRNIKIRPF